MILGTICVVVLVNACGVLGFAVDVIFFASIAFGVNAGNTFDLALALALAAFALNSCGDLGFAFAFIAFFGAHADADANASVSSF